MTLRRVAAIVAVLVLGAAVGVAMATLTPPGGTKVTAEFADAHGLGERGNEVRVQGAPAGTVENVELTPRGTALVTMGLRDGIPTPRRDAAAGIRPLDIYGDFYVSLSPGRDPRPLQGPIPLSRTVTRPQLDNVLRAFGEPVRSGVQALVVELGVGLERRGVDLNRAAVELKPALAAGDGVVRELATQRADLRELVADAEQMTGQLARRDRELGRTVEGLERVLAATGRREAALDAGLAGLPGTLSRLERTAGRLEPTARAGRPAARLAADSAPELAEVLQRSPPFLERASRTSRALRPAARRAQDLLGPRSPVAADLGEALPRLTNLGPSLTRLAEAGADAAPDAAQGLLVHLPEVASEPGRQPFDPAGDPRRRYVRVAGVLSCESFGRPIRPGCLAGAGTIASAAPAGRRSAKRRSWAMAERAGGRPRRGLPERAGYAERARATKAEADIDTTLLELLLGDP
ncbi:MAG TPA: MlaD family protein [Thermoleophilaceae bacterium]|nr:MlaD family protein [Thermoleophilaceae bacterium]